MTARTLNDDRHFMNENLPSLCDLAAEKLADDPMRFSLR